MNKFDKKYEIRLAKYDDIEMIMSFIDEHWKKNHILSVDRNLFEYEFLDGEIVNFVIAINKETNLLEGICGFLKCSDTEDPLKKDIWGSLWKIVDSRPNIPFLGIELAKRIYEYTNCRMHIGNGANPKTTIPLRKMFFKEYVGKMKQYYMLNPVIKEFHIASINNIPACMKHSSKKTKLRVINTIEELKEQIDIEQLNTIPYKDNWYFNKRYFQHPYYKYEVYALSDNLEETKAILVCREVTVNNDKILRIVDYLGDEILFEGLKEGLEKLLIERNLEYIDFYVYGFQEQYILNSGFVLNDGVNIIPNYFEPYTKTNVDIWVHHKDIDVKFYKADGDQDRPNFIFK